MAAKDIFHKAVRKSLSKEGWTITHDPLYINQGLVKMYIDLGAERVIAAEKGTEKIAVEIKSFIGDSAISAFHNALGQYLNYLLALEEKYTKYTLYLAVPSEIYDVFFSLPFVQKSVQRYQLKLLVYDPVKEVIVKWVK